jgi:hypothetical protein
MRLPRACVDAKDQHGPITIDHDSAQAIPRAVHYPVRIGAFGNHAVPEESGVSDSPLDEFLERLGMTREDVDRDVAVVREPECNRPTATVDESHRCPRRGSARETVRVDPRVTASDRPDGRSGEDQGLHMPTF